MADALKGKKAVPQLEISFDSDKASFKDGAIIVKACGTVHFHRFPLLFQLFDPGGEQPAVLRRGDGWFDPGELAEQFPDREIASAYGLEEPAVRMRYVRLRREIRTIAAQVAEENFLF
mgnify:CR=1 FL=1